MKLIFEYQTQQYSWTRSMNYGVSPVTSSQSVTIFVGFHSGSRGQDTQRLEARVCLAHCSTRQRSL